MHTPLDPIVVGLTIGWYWAFYFKDVLEKVMLHLLSFQFYINYHYFHIYNYIVNVSEREMKKIHERLCKAKFKENNFLKIYNRKLTEQ